MLSEKIEANYLEAEVKINHPPFDAGKLEIREKEYFQVYKDMGNIKILRLDITKYKKEFGKVLNIIEESLYGIGCVGFVKKKQCEITKEHITIMFCFKNVEILMSSIDDEFLHVTLITKED
jgi:hypothetical protein